MKKRVVLILAIFLIAVNSYNLYTNKDSFDSFGRHLVPITGLQSGNETGYVSVSVVAPATTAVGYPLMNATRTSGDSNALLNWTSVTHANYEVYYSSNVSLLMNITQNCTSKIPTGVSNFTGIVDTNYTDLTANTTQKRYYRVAARNGSYCNLTNETWGKFDIEVLAATFSYGTNEIDTISFPLIPLNSSLDSVIYTATAWGDFIAWYNISKSPPSLDTAYYTGTAWGGAIGQITLGYGYIFGPIATGYNLTLVGLVPQDNLTTEVFAATFSYGTNEIDTIGWHSALFSNDLFPLDPNPTAWGDFIAWYNASKSPPSLDTAYYTGTAWGGAVGRYEPGYGYIFGPIATGYNASYNRSEGYS